MSKPIRPSVGVYTVPDTYVSDSAARRFWRTSFRCGRGYLTAMDALGTGSILVPHEREEAEGFKRRCRFTKPRNFVGPIVRRYNSFVFRKPPTRAGSMPDMAAEIVEDATGSGVSLDQFMSQALLRAQVDRESYIMPDVEGALEAVESPTVAQVKAAGTRPILTLVPADAILNWEDEEGGGALCAVVIRMKRDQDGQWVLRWMDETMRQDFILDQREAESPVSSQQMTVIAADLPFRHGYEGCPLVRLRPSFDPFGTLMEAPGEGDSQAGPLSESQQAINNLLSLRNEEIENVTFSQMVMSGVSADLVKDVKVGNNRIICLPNPAGSVTFIGANPEQAASISAAIEDEAGNLFRLAGLLTGEAQDKAQSGVALAFRYNDLASIVSALSLACEDAEAQAFSLVAGAWGFEALERPVYGGKDSEMPDFAGETETLLSILLSSAVPAILREKAAERYAARNLSLSEEETERMRSEIAKGGALARANASAFPFPPRTPARGSRPPEDEEDEDEAAEGEG